MGMQLTDAVTRGTAADSMEAAQTNPRGPMPTLRRWYFYFFVISGACSLVYEVAWMRIAMADFGVTTPMVSIVISVFMAGLGLGSWGGGVATRRLETSSASKTLRFYAGLEFLIGISGVVVAPLLSWGRLVFERIQNVTGLGSLPIYFVSGVLVTAVLLPWCTCMGATLPFVMSVMRKSLGEDRERSFSFLYLANVLGALLGTLVPAFILFELLGFRGTLEVTALLNVALAATVLILSRAPSLSTSSAVATIAAPAEHNLPDRSHRRLNLYLLFLTGFVSMGLEVIWIRQFSPYLGTVVYSFALILAFYLLGTLEGSAAYRAWDRSRFPNKASAAWVIVGAAALVSLLSADPRVSKLGYVAGVVLALLAVGPFSGLVGFLTPMLVDDWCEGDPQRGGKAYGVNVLGCIVGPLAAGFCLLPWLGVRWSTALLAAPLFLAGSIATLKPEMLYGAMRRNARSRRIWVGAAVLSLLLVTGTEGYSDQFHQAVVKRDYTATVVATGSGMQERLLVNGIGITKLSPITKMMAHLPLAFLSRPPRNGLVICFGMGTTFRSMLSWGIPTTGVELVPSVPALFGYFHPDGPKLLKSPLAHVVIDDGRRFLERTSGRYDVIVIDPPPPVAAAGSSLLYSRQFYSLAKKRLRPGGILQQWLPGGSDKATEASVALAIQDSFRYVRVFGSIRNWGFHFLASDSPIQTLSADALAARMPPTAVADMLEWGPYSTAEKQFQKVLSYEIPITRLIAEDPSVPPLSDDRPVNEYFLLRSILPSSWMRGGL
jgi:spermidine synthase